MLVKAVSDYSRKAAPELLNGARARAILKDVGIDVFIATSPENVAHLSGYQCQTHWTNKGTLVFGVFSAEEGSVPIVIAPALELDAWAEEPPEFGEIIPCGTSAYRIGRDLGVEVGTLQADDAFIFDRGFHEQQHLDAIATLVNLLKANGFERARIALDEAGISRTVWNEIVSRLPATRFSMGAHVWRRIRMVKSDTEVELLTTATRNASRALQATIEIARPGVTEEELFRHYNTRIAEQGGMPVFAAINAGRRSGHPHPIASDYELKLGDVVKYDVGGTYRYYHGDIARTQVVGAPSDEQAHIYEALLKGEQAAIAALKPGVRPSEVFSVAVETIRSAGLREYRRHHVGHGIGIEIYDPPLIQPNDSMSELSGLGSLDEPLEANMIINIETPYYLLGKFGMTVEDTMLVTPTGARYLFDLPRAELFT